MRIVTALGGNALLRRGQPLTAENQRANVRVACEQLARIMPQHEVVIAHGNGPQVGLLALQGAAYKPDEAFPLDVLGAETDGMIGYMIEQALENALGHDRAVATLLTQIRVDPDDPAFETPTKFVGPVYDKATADEMAARVVDRLEMICVDQKQKTALADARAHRLEEILVLHLLLQVEEHLLPLHVAEQVLTVLGVAGGLGFVLYLLKLRRRRVRVGRARVTRAACARPRATGRSVRARPQ